MAGYERLNKEYRDIMVEPPLGITAGPKKCNNYEWDATLIGPTGTPYEGGIFKLKILIKKSYPFEAPKITFVTPIYHCNVGSDGAICLDILKDQWSPALTIAKALLSISSLLDEPNPTDPLRPDIAHLLKSNKAEHDIKARLFTEKYAN
jgi:ubiquitin-protein ligase